MIFRAADQPESINLTWIPDKANSNDAYIFLIFFYHLFFKIILLKKQDSLHTDFLTAGCFKKN